MTGRRWAYVGAIVGAGVSIAANVQHSYVPPVHARVHWHPYGGAVFGAVFWPVGLLIAIEILARNEWKAGWRWRMVRWCGLVPVAVVAAAVSYRHMSGLLRFWGEDSLTVIIGPLAVDGLMVMATGALIMTGRVMAEATYPIPVAVPVIPATPKPKTIEPETAPEPVPVSVPKRTQDKTQVAKNVGRPSARDALLALRTELPDAPLDVLANKAGVSVKTVRRHLTPA